MSSDGRLRLTNAPKDDGHHFLVAGISLRKANRTLKPAYPKKKAKPGTRVVFSVQRNKVTISLCGASFGMPAMASCSFNAEIPFLEYEQVMADSYEDGAVVTFEFGDGRMKVLGIESRSPEIVLQPGPGPTEQSTETPAASPPIVNPMDGPLGLPLLGVYAYVKKYGPHAAPGNANLIGQQRELEQIMVKADTLLKPLGLGRDDIERLLDQRIPSNE